MEETFGTLKEGEPHPSAHIAYKFFQEYCAQNNVFVLLEALASTALSGNRTAEICCETMQRILDKKPVSDRYLMGLAWYFYALEQKQNNETTL